MFLLGYMFRRLISLLYNNTQTKSIAFVLIYEDEIAIKQKIVLKNSEIYNIMCFSSYVKGDYI